MKQTYLKRTDSNRLTLFFAGWGMDATPFADMIPADSDLLLCYDYSSLAWDETSLAHYDAVKVVAWSMGVWAASQVLPTSGLPITESVAVGGTPYPISDTWGIPTAIFHGTLATLSERNLQKFNRRMCATREQLDHFNAHAPHRTLDNLITELRLIGEHAPTLPPQHW